MDRRLGRGEWLALMGGLLTGAGFLLHQLRYPSSLYDAAQYVDMGRALLERGIASPFMKSEVRTYGYPLFLSVLERIVSPGTAFRIVLFVVQGGLFAGGAVLLRQALLPWSPRVARAVFGGVVLNYYAWVYAPESLTENLSLTALVLLAAAWLAAYRRGGPLVPMSAGSLLAGFAVMIRPANIFMLIAWLIGAGLILWRATDARRAVVAASLVLASAAVPFAPQLAYNVHHFGRWTPLLARDLGQRQRAWGIQDLKYATAMPPSPDSAIHYVNPWLAETTFDEEAPSRWYRQYPGRTALTFAVHSFNLTDQDLLFTYSRDLDPWYRVPLGIVNHAAVALGLIGLVAAIGRIRRSGGHAARDAIVLLAITVGGAWALHIWTAVEMRFGLPLLCVLFPAAAWALTTIRETPKTRVALLAGLIIVYVAGALEVSAWVRGQSPVIRAGRASRTAAVRADDADHDPVRGTTDRCPTTYGATADGCPAPSAGSGDGSGTGVAQIAFADPGSGRTSAWLLDRDAGIDGRGLAASGEPGSSIVVAGPR